MGSRSTTFRTSQRYNRAMYTVNVASICTTVIKASVTIYSKFWEIRFWNRDWMWILVSDTETINEKRRVHWMWILVSDSDTINEKWKNEQHSEDVHFWIFSRLVQPSPCAREYPEIICILCLINEHGLSKVTSPAVTGQLISRTVLWPLLIQRITEIAENRTRLLLLEDKSWAGLMKMKWCLCDVQAPLQSLLMESNCCWQESCFLVNVHAHKRD